MSAETTLNAALKAAPAVTALVGQRIYPDNVPQEQAPPYVAFTRSGTEYVGTIHGTVVGSKASLEVWCMSSSRKEAEAIADAIETAAAAAKFIPTGRRAEFDSEAEMWGAVLSVDFWS